MQKSSATVEVARPRSHHSQETLKNLPYIQVSLLVVLSFISLIANMNICYLLGWLPKRKLKRPANILTGHMSALLVLFTFILFWNFGVRNELVESGVGICELQAFLANTFHYVLGLNVAVLTYERMSTVQVTFRKFYVFRSILYMWIAGIAGAVPTIWQYQYEPGTFYKAGKCKKIMFLGSYFLDELVNIGGFFSFHFLPTFYVMRVLYKLSGKPRYLYLFKPIPKPNVRKRVQSLRFVCFNSVTFIFVWLPLGGITFICNAMSEVEPTSLNSSISIVYLLYFIFNPILHLLFNEDLSQLSGLSGGNKFWNAVAEQQPKQSLGQPNLYSKPTHFRKHRVRQIKNVEKSPESFGKCHCFDENNVRDETPLAPPPSPINLSRDSSILNLVFADVTVHQLGVENPDKWGKLISPKLKDIYRDYADEYKVEEIEIFV